MKSRFETFLSREGVAFDILHRPDGSIVHLDSLNSGFDGGFDGGWQEQRDRVLAFIREQATKGTADYEYKLTKLADAIERGEHEV